MPPWCEIGGYAQLGKAVHIGIVLNPEVRTSDLDMVVLTQFFFCHLHTVQDHTRSSFADGVYVQIQTCLIEFFHDLSHLLCIESRSTQHTILVRRNHRRSLYLHRP